MLPVCRMHYYLKNDTHRPDRLDFLRNDHLQLNSIFTRQHSRKIRQMKLIPVDLAQTGNFCLKLIALLYIPIYEKLI